MENNNNDNNNYQKQYYEKIKQNGKYEDNKRKLREAYDGDAKKKKREYYLANCDKIKTYQREKYHKLKEVKQQ
jgi:hypothetical protein